ncbi:Unknown protein sequence [Pseudomonas coronafaciens pv. oryzae]|uniref:hypothetical protein n=1 Tax=Pseudomonas coronafaciens TaxID=53409 RepID=UPI0006E4EBDB|nr:hypothetical protein [Pseudomonas coronafaciens]KPY09320.1 Unknown protein sequence [Pseudomonas coronafaciens pv. oryzae]RMT03840.1 hypothetical protein ALP55_01695 [Pseudomonas coronafaciens pv. oryzae]
MEGLDKMVARAPQEVLVKMAGVEAMEVLESTAGLVETEEPVELEGLARLAEMVEMVVLEAEVRRAVMAAMVVQEVMAETAVMGVTAKIEGL